MGIRGYININFSVFPLIFNWNAISLGIINGVFNSIIIRNNLEKILH
jgi:hypothetical protein